MRHNIEFPNSTSYFIAYNSLTDTVWGSCQPDQVMKTPYLNVWQTSNRAEWITELEKYSVIEGYQFDNLEEAQILKEIIEDQTGTNIEVKIANLNQPSFSYIKGNFNLIEKDSKLFQVMGG